MSNSEGSSSCIKEGQGPESKAQAARQERGGAPGNRALGQQGPGRCPRCPTPHGLRPVLVGLARRKTNKSFVSFPSFSLWKMGRAGLGIKASSRGLHC